VAESVYQIQSAIRRTPIDNQVLQIVETLTQNGLNGAFQHRAWIQRWRDDAQFHGEITPDLISRAESHDQT
jgi:hypothetical protein